jgi:hypothetical protein
MRAAKAFHGDQWDFLSAAERQEAVRRQLLAQSEGGNSPNESSKPVSPVSTAGSTRRQAAEGRHEPDVFARLSSPPRPRNRRLGSPPRPAARADRLASPRRRIPPAAADVFARLSSPPRQPNRHPASELPSPRDPRGRLASPSGPRGARQQRGGGAAVAGTSQRRGARLSSPARRLHPAGLLTQGLQGGRPPPLHPPCAPLAAPFWSDHSHPFHEQAI